VSALSKILRQAEGGVLTFFCPGCKDWHSVDPKRWTWNGDAERPTFNPSLLVRSGHYIPGHAGTCWCDYHREAERGTPGYDLPAPTCYVCHSFIRDGQIQFLGDCTHSLAGQTAPIPPWKESR
jgi:uncharacterized protein DUF6527